MLACSSPSGTSLCQEYSKAFSCPYLAIRLMRRFNGGMFSDENGMHLERHVLMMECRTLQ
ncbi:hypothetical protein OESDEN_02374 [Oesophagostomum dentatum]|uniref:Uncharacterized protein n=1 Tax=Oesophagostomum dentatum TaxID=61180 RepID=A0A0B1TKB3_OESDE|nr:hypothetical protein OESDEN_02374 [Oesophagostomum dentatum]